MAPGAAGAQCPGNRAEGAPGHLLILTTHPLSWSLALTLGQAARPLLRGSARWSWSLPPPGVQHKVWPRELSFLGSGPPAKAVPQPHGSKFSACRQYCHPLATREACPPAAFQVAQGPAFHPESCLGPSLLACQSLWGPCGCWPSQENTEDPSSLPSRAPQEGPHIPHLGCKWHQLQAGNWAGGRAELTGSRGSGSCPGQRGDQVPEALLPPPVCSPCLGS